MSAQLSAPRGVIARHALTGALEGLDLVLIDSARPATALHTTNESVDVTPARFLALFVVPTRSALVSA